MNRSPSLFRVHHFLADCRHHMPNVVLTPGGSMDLAVEKQEGKEMLVNIFKQNEKEKRFCFL